jgi:hypothetical protein
MSHDVETAAEENGMTSNERQRNARPPGRTGGAAASREEGVVGSQSADDWIAAVAARTAAIRRSVATSAQPNRLPPR